MNTNKIKQFHREFSCYLQKYHIHNVKGNLLFLHWMHYRLKYGIDMEGYFVNKIWQRHADKEAYFSSFHKYIHSWKYAFAKFHPNGHSECYYRFDYLISKVQCPGLDAMDYFRYEFYNYRYEKKRSFITEGMLGKIVRKFNKEKKYRAITDDKVTFNNLFREYLHRDWLVSSESNLESYLQFFNKHRCVIVKPIDGGGGKGIYKECVEGKEQVRFFFEKTHPKNLIIEEVIEQHTHIAALNPWSVNTIRVYSVEYQGEFFITAATLRMGNGNHVTDNYSAGGLMAGIDIKTGIVVSRAVSQNNDEYYIHPTTGCQIIGFKIPEWEKIKQTVKSAHAKIPQLRYVGWDVVVNRNNDIALIEANSYPGVALQQHPMKTGVKDIYRQFL